VRPSALHHILRPVSCKVPFARVARALRARRALFHELRDALRRGPKPAHLTRPRAAEATIGLALAVQTNVPVVGRGRGGGLGHE
jgi:hypothetical protein